MPFLGGYIKHQVILEVQCTEVKPDSAASPRGFSLYVTKRNMIDYFVPDGLSRLLSRPVHADAHHEPSMKQHGGGDGGRKKRSPSPENKFANEGLRLLHAHAFVERLLLRVCTRAALPDDIKGAILSTTNIRHTHT